MRAANLSKEWREENPLTHSAHLLQKQLNRERSLRSQICDLT